MWSPNREVVSRSALLGRRTTSKVGIGEEVWLQRVEFITDPPNHTEMLGGVDVTHKSMKLAVTLGRPLGDKSRQVTNRTQQIEATKPSGIQYFHKNFCCYRLQSPFIRGRRRRAPIFLTRLRRNSANFNITVVIALCFDIFKGGVYIPRCWFSPGSIIGIM